MEQVSSNGNYQNLEWEITSPAYNNSKRLFTTADNVERVKGLGEKYRLSYPNEFFGLMIDGFEGKLPQYMYQTFHDMLFSYGELLGMALERKVDELIVYLDTTANIGINDKIVSLDSGSLNIIGINNKMQVSGIFNIKGLASGSLADLELLDDKLVRLVYSRPFSELPKFMRVGHKRARIEIPYEGKIMPVGTCFMNECFSIHIFSQKLASRWVYEKP